MTMADDETVLELSHKILDNAAAHGANCIVVACPMCHVNLDMKQAGDRAALRRAVTIWWSTISRTWSAWRWAWTRQALGIDRHFVVKR